VDVACEYLIESYENDRHEFPLLRCAVLLDLLLTRGIGLRTIGVVFMLVREPVYEWTRWRDRKNRDDRVRGSREI
jgi:hypothetical protein